MVIDLSEEKARAVAAEIGDGKGMFAAIDVTDEEGVKSSIKEATNSWGPLNCVVNCAGIAPPMRVINKKGQPHDLKQFAKVMSINTVGTFNIVRLAAESMAKGDIDAVNPGCRGVIINTASIAAMDGQIGQAAYAASKGAVVSMTLPLARDLSSLGVRVNTIAPGLFLTPMLEGLPESVQNDLASTVPFPKRLGNPDDYASLVETIIKNPMLNGETIRLDGALRMQP